MTSPIVPLGKFVSTRRFNEALILCRAFVARDVGEICVALPSPAVNRPIRGWTRQGLRSRPVVRSIHDGRGQEARRRRTPNRRPPSYDGRTKSARRRTRSTTTSTPHNWAAAETASWLAASPLIIPDTAWREDAVSVKFCQASWAVWMGESIWRRISDRSYSCRPSLRR